MKNLLVSWFPVGSLRGWILRGYASHPFLFSLALSRSIFATFALTRALYPLSVRVNVGQKLITSVGKRAKVEIYGVLTVAGWGGCYLPSSLTLGSESSIKILGDFEIGPNVHISTHSQAEIEFGGVKESSGSGITCNTRVMAERRITIGADSIIAWDVLITDSDWHKIEGSCRMEDVEIGDHVWLAHGVSVLKGAVIPAGCVVAAKSLVQNKFSGRNLLLAGIPAGIIREEIQWTR